VNAEEPRLAPYLDVMTAAVRDALGGAHVSITPKRGEGVGAVGRREAVQCWAVALLESDESSGT
jgi:2C-methyl-D-erythritol 2,4-cyclodiphosphate synthase